MYEQKNEIYRLTKTLAFLLGMLSIALGGCGTTKSFTATEQLLMSDAVDTTVSQIDFSPLSDRRVYLDTTYLKTIKSPLLIDSDYVISSLRQQMLGASVLLVESREQADVVAEARLGALGMDGHSVTYGLPASTALSTATSVFSNTPLLPPIPEVSLAKHEEKLGAAKLAVFAYERETREPVWQSGIAKSSSSAKDTWVLGVGPWQRGTIYDGTRFAGQELEGPSLLGKSGEESVREMQQSDAFAAYQKTRIFAAQPTGDDASDESEVVTASAEEPATDGDNK